ncbi:olfactory receptor 5M11-like [Lissotriton helveticus]
MALMPERDSITSVPSLQLCVRCKPGFMTEHEEKKKDSMEKRNGSTAIEFLLLGLSENPLVQKFLFVLLIVIYMFTICSNITLLTAKACDPRLDRPMYFFLSHLFFINICTSTLVVPNMLAQIIEQKRMSMSACAVQLYSFVLLANTECFLLAVMAFDRFVAISLALRYNVIMSKTVCITTVTFCWLSSSLSALLETVFTLQLSFCGHSVINHFFCDPSAVVKIACGDTIIMDMIIVCVAAYAELIPLIIILFSYTRIAITVMGIHSSEGRYKAFSTCASHLIVVSISAVPAGVMYLKPVSKHSFTTFNNEKLISVFYTVIHPVLNPIVYGLRNKDVKMALQKITRRFVF